MILFKRQSSSHECLHKREFRAPWIFSEAFPPFSPTRKLTRTLKGMDQRPRMPRFLMKSVTWELVAKSMGPSLPEEAWWQIPAHDGQQKLPLHSDALAVGYHGSSTMAVLLSLLWF